MNEIDIKTAFFPVDTRPVFWQGNPTIFEPNGPHIEATRHYAIVDVQRESYFTIVSENYYLVTNQEAFSLQNWIADSIFYAEDSFFVKDVYISENRGNCVIDLVRSTNENQPLANSGWVAFIRMINSYNKSRSLSYEFGFYFMKSDRWFPIVLPEISKVFSAPHSGGNPIRNIKENIERKLENGELESITAIEEEFATVISTLQKIYIDYEDMMPMAFKVFGFRKPDHDDAPSARKQFESMSIIEDLIKQKIQDYGDNAYSLLLVLAEYTSMQRYDYSPNYDLEQQKLGKWVESIIAEKEKKGDRFDNAEYIGQAFYSAYTWYRKKKRQAL